MGGLAGGQLGVRGRHQYGKLHSVLHKAVVGARIGHPGLDERGAVVGVHDEQAYGGMPGSGVTGGFEQLMTQHHREIYLSISRLTRGSLETDDLLQETFLRAYQAFKRLPEDAHMKAWLFSIATNLCRNYFQPLQRHPDGPLQEVQEMVGHALSLTDGTSHGDPEQIILAQDIERRMRVSIDALPRQQKAALIQRKLHGLSYAHIATSLQCSQESARAHVFQALKKIRAAVEMPPSGSRSPRRTEHDGMVRDLL